MQTVTVCESNCSYCIWFQKGCQELLLDGRNKSLDVKKKSQPTNKTYSASWPKKEFSNWFTSLSADGLIDCMDPDCCLQSSCQNQPYCRGLPDPQDIISQSLQSPSQQAAKSFYDRISFLIGSDSTHVIPGESPFNKRLTHFSLRRFVMMIINSYKPLIWNADDCKFEESAFFKM